MPVLMLLIGLLPASTVKNRLLSLVGHDVARSAVIRPCVLWRVHRLHVGDNAYVGIGNVFRDMRRVSIGDGAEIGQFNEVTGVAKWVEQQEPDMSGTLLLADKAAITGRHFMDCSGGVAIGHLSVIGGFKSTFITRGLDVRTGLQKGRPARIGERCLITARVVIIPGITIADRCVVAAGSVVAKDLLVEETLYAGNPAKAVSSLAGVKFFDRSEARGVPRDIAKALMKDSRRN